MRDKTTKEYTNGEVTVVWKPNLCIHSAICWNGLGAVFNPRKRPWINMAAAASDAIIAQVDECPSGALSYFRNDTKPKPMAAATRTIVEVSANGPLIVRGNIIVKDTDGTEKYLDRVTTFCRCGHSHNKPFCDGTHVTAKFKG